MGVWNGGGGKYEAGETPDEGAIREVFVIRVRRRCSKANNLSLLMWLDALNYRWRFIICFT